MWPAVWPIAWKEERTKGPRDPEAASRNGARIFKTTMGHAQQEELGFSAANIKTESPSSLEATLSFTSRDEMNLAEFPLTVLSTRTNQDIKTLEFADTQRLSNGEVITRQWIITGADKFGLPTSTDDDVLLGLMRLSMDQGFRDPKVYFTRYELLRVLRWTTEGRSYSRLTKSLDRLSGVRIRASNAFFDNESKAYQTKNFGIIDAYEINDSRSGRSLSKKKENQMSYFIWSEALFQSFQAGFIKKLDLNLYFQLRSAVSRRLYRYLDKHFYYKSSLERPLTVLAFEKLGLSRSYNYISQIKQQLEPAADELVRIGFLERYEFLGKGSDTTVRFEAPQKKTSLLPGMAAANTSRPSHWSRPELRDLTSSVVPAVFPAPVSGGEETFNGERSLKTAIVEALITRGISLNQATRLLQGKQDAELRHIDQIISYYDYLVQSQDTKVSKNRIGFLYRAVEFPHRFVLPKSFGDGGGLDSRGLKPEELGDKFRVQESRVQANRAQASGGMASGQTRPERQLVKRGRDAETLESEAYEGFVEEQFQAQKSQMTEQQLGFVYQQIRAKMKPLKSVLDGPSFEKAVAGCVREEIVKIAHVPSKTLWQRRRAG